MPDFRADHEFGTSSAVCGFNEAPPAGIHLKQLGEAIPAQFGQQIVEAFLVIGAAVVGTHRFRMAPYKIMNNGCYIHIINIYVLLVR